MRYTQPLTAEEQRIDAAMRAERRSSKDCDRALTFFRMAQQSRAQRDLLLGRTADLILDEAPL